MDKIFVVFEDSWTDTDGVFVSFVSAFKNQLDAESFAAQLNDKVGCKSALFSREFYVECVQLK